MPYRDTRLPKLGEFVAVPRQRMSLLGDPLMRVPGSLQGVVNGLHHVAIAVRSLAESRKVYEYALGLASSEPEFVPSQRVNVLVLFAGTQRIELVEPASEDSPVSKFIETRGAGIHHLAWKVDNC